MMFDKIISRIEEKGVQRGVATPGADFRVTPRGQRTRNGEPFVPWKTSGGLAATGLLENGLQKQRYFFGVCKGCPILGCHYLHGKTSSQSGHPYSGYHGQRIYSGWLSTHIRSSHSSHILGISIQIALILGWFTGTSQLGHCMNFKPKLWVGNSTFKGRPLGRGK